jgi:hypothetical protein
MIPLVAFPELVEHYAPFFRDIFSAEAFIEFKRYLSGLLIAENKTVEGINRFCLCESRNQSSLNRLLTRSPFELAALEKQRLALLASVPETQMKRTGVWSLDDTLLTHYGQHFEKIAYLWDHVDQCYRWAHNLVSLHYSDDETDYPCHYQLWEPPDLAKLEAGLLAAEVKLRESKYALKDSAPQQWRQYLLGVWRRHQQQSGVAELHSTKLRIAERLLEEWLRLHPELRLPVTFDNWYTQPGFCQFLSDHLQLAYVGTLAPSDQLILQTGAETLQNFAARLKHEHEENLKHARPPVFKPISIPYKGQRETYFSYCATHRVHHFGKHRVVINHRQADLSDTPVFLLSNRLHWQAPGITRIRRHRWPIEVYYEEGKAEGLDQYQLRDFAAVQRHVALVAVVYSLLRAAQYDHTLRDILQGQLKVELEGSVPFWRRATQAQSLWALGLFIQAGLTQGQSLHSIMAPLLRAVCPAGV